jgi:hypothetical protein
MAKSPARHHTHKTMDVKGLFNADFFDGPVPSSRSGAKRQGCKPDGPGYRAWESALVSGGRGW